MTKRTIEIIDIDTVDDEIEENNPEEQNEGISRASSVTAIFGGLLIALSAFLPLYYRVTDQFITVWYALDFKIFLLSLAAMAVILGFIVLNRKSVRVIKELKEGDHYYFAIGKNEKEDFYFITGENKIKDTFYKFKNWLYRKKVIDNLFLVYFTLGCATYFVHVGRTTDKFGEYIMGISRVYLPGFHILILGGIVLMFAGYLVNHESKDLKWFVVIGLILGFLFSYYNFELPEVLKGNRWEKAKVIQAEVIELKERKNQLAETQGRILRMGFIERMEPAEILKDGEGLFRDNLCYFSSLVLHALIQLHPDSAEAIEAKLLLPKVEECERKKGK